MAVFLAGAAAGCGGDRGKGTNRGKDMPTPPAKDDKVAR
jgi:hypothetical protein